MRNREEVISRLISTAVFLVLEGCAVFLVARGGAIQNMRFMSAVRDAQSAVWDKTSEIKAFVNYKSENERLSLENLALRQQLEEYKSFVSDNDTVFSYEDPQFGFHNATVVKNTVGKQHNYLIINKGERDGIKEGMGVVTDRGVVGIVTSTGQRYSNVISYLNNTQSVSAKLQKDGAFGPMEWSGKNISTAYLHEIPAHVEIAPGDTVVTSGFSSIYPAEIPLGTVEKTEIIFGTTQRVTVNLFENFRSLRHVYVVENNRLNELKEVEK